jgi:hypothetical protein
MPGGQAMWDLWWAKWHWDRFFSEFFSFSLSVSFHFGSPYSYITWGMNNKPNMNMNNSKVVGRQ